MGYQIEQYGFILNPDEIVEPNLSVIFSNPATGLINPMGPAYSNGIDPTPYLPMSEHPDFDWYKDMDSKPRNADNAWDIGAFVY